MRNVLRRIARKYLHLNTLDRRNSDSLDFHDLAVWQIRAALEAAYKAGAADRRTLAKELKNLHNKGQYLIEALDGTICGDEPEFEKFRAAVNRASKHMEGGAP